MNQRQYGYNAVLHTAIQANAKSQQGQSNNGE
jgi:hypothetical protein